MTDPAITTLVDVSQPYTGEEIEFLQCLLDRYSEGGGIIDLGSDVDAFMAIVRKHVPRLTAEQANAAEIAELTALLREARGALSSFAGALFHYVPDGTGLEFASPANMRLDDESQLTIGDLQIAQATYERIDTILNKKDAPHECAR